MIQRIQSLLLLAAAILNLAVLGTPLWFVNNPIEKNEAVLTGLNIEITGTNPSITGLGDSKFLLLQFIFILVASGFTLFTIFNYQDRKKQIRYTFFSRALISFQLLITILIVSKELPGMVNSAEEYPGNYGFGLFFPVAAILLIWFAANRIKKDEELVKSMDRFR